MSSIINATTNNGLVITPDNSGQIQFQLNGVNVPSPSVAPAFSAYQSVAQSISSGTLTKVMFQSKEFDTNSNFDNVTNYRFTPTVAGYYQVNCQINMFVTSTVESIVDIYKNGFPIKSIADLITPQARLAGGSALIYLNGSTDYIEIYYYSSVAGTISTGSGGTYFQAFLARTA